MARRIGTPDITHQTVSDHRVTNGSARRSIFSATILQYGRQTHRGRRRGAQSEGFETLLNAPGGPAQRPDDFGGEPVYSTANPGIQAPRRRPAEYSPIRRRAYCLPEYVRGRRHRAGRAGSKHHLANTRFGAGAPASGLLAPTPPPTIGVGTKAWRHKGAADFAGTSRPTAPTPRYDYTHKCGAALRTLKDYIAATGQDRHT